MTPKELDRAAHDLISAKIKEGKIVQMHWAVCMHKTGSKLGGVSPRSFDFPVHSRLIGLLFGVCGMPYHLQK